MKTIKSYTNIWSVEKVIYAINDLRLPFPVSFTQMTWFICSLLFVILFANLPPLSFVHGALLKYFGIPAGLTWFMSQKTFDGKKPLSFMQSVITYFLRAKQTYAGKVIHLHKQQVSIQITTVRSEAYGRLSD